MPIKRSYRSSRRVFNKKKDPDIAPGKGASYVLTRETLDSHTPFVVGVCWRFKNRAMKLGVSKDELLTIAKGFLLHRIDKYDPSRGAATTFITQVLDSSFNAWFKKMEKQQRVRPGFEGDSGTLAAWQRPSRDPARTSEQRDALRRVDQVARQSLSPKQYRVFVELMVRGRSDTDVARETGYTPDSLRGVLVSIRKKLNDDPRLSNIIAQLGVRKKRFRSG